MDVDEAMVPIRVGLWTYISYEDKQKPHIIWCGVSKYANVNGCYLAVRATAGSGSATGASAGGAAGAGEA